MLRQLDLIDVRLTRVLSFIAFLDSSYVQPQSVVLQTLNKYPARARYIAT